MTEVSCTVPVAVEGCVLIGKQKKMSTYFLGNKQFKSKLLTDDKVR